MAICDVVDRISAYVDVDGDVEAVNRSSGSASAGCGNTENHNVQVSKLLQCLGATGEGRRAVIDAVAKLQGIDDVG